MTTAPVPAAPAPRPATSRRRAWFAGLLLLAGLAAVGACSYLALRLDERAAAAAPPADEPRERVRAPELEGGIAWLNAAGPVRLRDLKGKFVLLDFWTLCCINCIHTLPDLAKLEHKYANQLVVIGVHSAKFDNEKNSESIRKAILRYEIAHPVVNDANMKIWRTYGVQSWPTLVLIDPEGYVVGGISGEGHFKVLDEVLTDLIKTHRDKKTLNEQPLRFDLARFQERGDSPLFFPGKVLADGKGGRLFIADSTHHRVLVTDLNGKQLAVAGTGRAGKSDGTFATATFNDPQGMALNGDTLYVADRKNHLIRALDLKAQTVKTIAGVGTQGQDRRLGGPALTTGLNSPWDLYLEGDRLFIAMAGHHQIWEMDLKEKEVAPYAGAGPENIRDGPLRTSLFSQPSGLTSDGKNLYVADSEVSAIRQVPLIAQGRVKTIVGRGLFDFGDVDGEGDEVRLQHALGVAWHDGKLYVADTYNSKIKVIDPAARTCQKFVGDDRGWLTDPTFNEPAGLSIANGKIYVADTNAHRIRVVDLKTKAVTTLALKGVTAPPPEEDDRPFFPNATRVTVQPATVPAGGELTLEVALELPRGFKLNPQAKMRVLVEALPGGQAAWSAKQTLPEVKATFRVPVPAAKLAGAAGLRLSLVYYECGEGSEAICRVKSRIWEVPLKFDAAATERVIALSSAAAPKDEKKE